MKITWKEDKYAIIAVVCFTTIMFLIAFLTNGTCDEGDSVMHYLFARYAFAHHENFFNHWAKPFYVLVMSPSAQFGFLGAKVFNTFLSCVSVWFTYLIARELKYKWAISVFFIALFFKTFMTVTFSGLTEPLNNALISIAIYLAFTRRYIMATIIFSFLPFVRSEGLFLCGTFSLYLLWMRQWKALPFLVLGHVVYSIAGYPYFKDFLWVWHQIPYNYSSTHYGHGGWLYYVQQMPMISGVLNCIFLTISILATFFVSIYCIYKKKWADIPTKSIFLLFVFAVFFLMHTTFWALGIFGSFGLIRVFIAIACVMMLIMASAVEFLLNILPQRLRLLMLMILIPLYFIFAANSSPYSYSKLDFGLHPDELTDSEMASYVKLHYPNYKGYNLFFDACFFSVLLDVDMFDEHKYMENGHFHPGEDYPNKSIIIWDDWYSEFEHNAHLDSLRNNKSLKEIITFQKPNQWNQMRKVTLFVKDN